MRRIIIAHNGRIIKSEVAPDNGAIPAPLYEQGYRDVADAKDAPLLSIDDIANFLHLIPYYEFNEKQDIYIKSWIKFLDTDSVQDKIKDIKNQLANLDYMNSKNEEYAAVGLELPYTWAEIHAAKQPLRDEINRLEQLINIQQ